jgi:predicted RNA binding protein YcfA (HicA-like mRNA interferase family)
MSGNELVKLLKKNGWILDRICGSHHIMVKAGRRSVPVPVHGKKDLPKGLVSTILKQAEIKL